MRKSKYKTKCCKQKWNTGTMKLFYFNERTKICKTIEVSVVDKKDTEEIEIYTSASNMSVKETKNNFSFLEELKTY